MLDLYRTLFKTTLAQQLQYRAALTIWLLGFVFEPVVYMVVWMTVSAGRGGNVGGYDTPALALYFILVMLQNHLTFDWHFFEMEMRVRTGSFSPLLLRPAHPIHADLADNFVYKMLTFPIMLLAAAGLCLNFNVMPHPPLWACFAYVPALALSFAMRFTVEWTLALAAFWTTRTRAVNTVYILAGVFLSGRMAPLAVLPPGLRAVALALPFRLWISFPVELLLGRTTWEETRAAMGLQCVWLLVIVALFRMVWWRGMRRYSAVGA
jgi:ABC-2 type transport system permease protein